jgi:hypothetical protein
MEEGTMPSDTKAASRIRFRMLLRTAAAAVMLVADPASASAAPPASAARPATSMASVYPTYLSFGARRVGSTSYRTVTATNTGNAPLRVSSVTTSDAAFVVGTDFCSYSTLAPGQQCSFDAGFRPLQRGMRQGYYHISDNAPGSPQTVQASGTGT